MDYLSYDREDYNFTGYYLFGNESYTYEFEETIAPLPAPSILSMVVYVLTFALGVPGNGAVVWVTGFRMKRSVNTVWFLNLAAADLIYCLSLPFMVANVALRNSWPRDAVLCKLLPSAIHLNMAASVFLLTLISVDRCLAVTRPVWSQRHRSLAWARAACVMAWGLAFLLCLPALLTRQMISLPEFGLTYCGYNYSGTYFGAETKVVVEVSRALLAFGLPVLVMATCYLLIVLKLLGGKFAKSGKPLRLVAAVVASFVICWLPYHVCGLVQAFSPQPAALVWDSVSVGLASLNSALNPFLYVFAGRDFRLVFRRSLASSLRRAFTEERSETSFSTRFRTVSSADAGL